MTDHRHPLDERDWIRLAAMLRGAMAGYIPEWTGDGRHDPGVVFAQVFAFLGEELLSRADAIPERGRAAIREVIARLDAMLAPDAAGPISVFVDGARWNEVSSLAHAGPDDAAYVVDEECVVTFGDGTHGRRPRSGARVGVAYREGTGERGNVRVAVECRWPPPARRYEITLAPTPTIRVCASAAAAESYGGVKRVHYFEGQLLGEADLRDEQTYHAGKRQLHNRALHGYGVVEGLAARVQAGAAPPAVIVEPGFALDAQGREIVLAEPLSVALRDGSSPCVVVLEYAERLVDPVPGPVPDTQAYARVEEGAAIRIVADGDCAKGVALARLVQDSAGWAVDPAFAPTRQFR
jgi:hypothetical protein